MQARLQEKPLSVCNLSEAAAQVSDLASKRGAADFMSIRIADNLMGQVIC